MYHNLHCEICLCMIFLEAFASYELNRKQTKSGQKTTGTKIIVVRTEAEHLDHSHRTGNKVP